MFHSRSTFGKLAFHLETIAQAIPDLQQENLEHHQGIVSWIACSVLGLGVFLVEQSPKSPPVNARIVSFDEILLSDSNNSAKVSAEMKTYQPIPIIAEFTNEDGSDNLKETTEANYRMVKQDTLSLVASEMERIKNDPNLKGLIKE